MKDELMNAEYEPSIGELFQMNNEENENNDHNDDEKKMSRAQIEKEQKTSSCLIVVDVLDRQTSREKEVKENFI